MVEDEGRRIWATPFILFFVFSKFCPVKCFTIFHWGAFVIDL